MSSARLHAAATILSAAHDELIASGTVSFHVDEDGTKEAESIIWSVIGRSGGEIQLPAHTSRWSSFFDWPTLAPIASLLRCRPVAQFVGAVNQLRCEVAGFGPTSEALETILAFCLEGEWTPTGSISTTDFQPSLSREGVPTLDCRAAVRPWPASLVNELRSLAHSQFLLSRHRQSPLSPPPPPPASDRRQRIGLEQEDPKRHRVYTLILAQIESMPTKSGRWMKDLGSRIDSEPGLHDLRELIGQLEADVPQVWWTRS